jgi:hypothetical protein
MKHYIVYVNGAELPGTLKAGSHNAAEKKARNLYGPSTSQVQDYIRSHPFSTPERARAILETNISVAYTEI